MNPMPFSMWLEACGELAVLRRRADDFPGAATGQLLLEPQRLLEDGDVAGASARLADVVEELANTPALGLAVTSLYGVLRLYDGVEQVPVKKPES